MLDIDAVEPSLHRTPWNKGRLIGQKRPLKPKEVWAIRSGFNSNSADAISLCSIWPSTAS